MPTATEHATDGAHSPSAPLLTGDDLEDAGRFVTVRKVPLLDVHDDPEHGPVDGPMLHRLAANTNAMVARGNYPPLVLGHTRHKTTVIFYHGDKKLVRPGADELNQPPVVGHTSGYHVADYDGRPCLYCDFHVHRDDAAYARKFPYRSVERLTPEGPDGDPAHHTIDRIALLRTMPRRDLGVLHYEKDEASAAVLRICSARDFPPTEDGDPDPTSSPDPDPVSPPTTPTTTPNEKEDAMAEATAAPIAPAAAAAPDPPAPKLGDMDPQTFVAMLAAANADAIRSVLAEHLDTAEEPAPGAEPEPPADHEPDQYEAPEEPEMEDSNVQQYEAEPGGDDTFVPDDHPIGEACDGKARKMYARLGLEEGNGEQVLIVLFDRLVEMELKDRRHNFSRRIDAVRTDGYEVDAEHEAELLAELTPDSPPDHEDHIEARMRKHYARRAVNQPRVPTVVADVAPPGANGITADDRARAVAYASRNGGSFTDALKAVRAK